MLEIISVMILYLSFLLFIVGFGFYVVNILRHHRQDKLSELKPSKGQSLDFAVLVLRWYLAYYMFDYGSAKMMGEQFGVYDPDIFEKPLKEVSKVQLAWHLFSLDKSFNIGVGIIQIVGAILIVINRTVLVGALLLLPVLVQIFLVDLAFTTEVFGWALPVRLIGMIASDFLILYYYKDRVVLAWNNLTNGTTTKFKYKWWVFLLLPVLGLLTDFGIGLLTSPFKLFKLLTNFMAK